jgi:hypothetical protein
MKNNVLMLLTTLIALNGCSHYEQRVALGAVAGAATGALVADSTYGGYGYGGYGHGGYVRPRYATPYYGHSGVNCRPTGIYDYGPMGSIQCDGY